MMNAVRLVVLAAALSTGVLTAAPAASAAEIATVDLTRWTPPDIAALGEDPFGKLVKYGYRLFTNTANEIGPAVADPKMRFAGNNLTCQDCHLRGGTQPYAMPLVGIWGQFPRYRAREGAVVLLQDRINGCMARSMNGRALPIEGREMTALASFMRWLSTGVPDGAKLIGAGTLQIKDPARAGDPARGANVYAEDCAICHGVNGQGQRAQSGAGYQFPPLWGPDSFNDGAGMDRLLTAAAYAMHNMPLGTTFRAPVLTNAQAYDVAAYIVSRKRPHFVNLGKDFPILLQKPIDAPFGPYADGFSAEQHKFGPFGPIRAKVEELAGKSGIANAGGPDNGSEKTD